MKRILKRQVRSLFNAIRGSSLLKGKEQLFDGKADIFLQETQNANTYFEYGVGLSTMYATGLDNIRHVVSVDSSDIWISSVAEQIGANGKANLVHVDVGEIGEWGRPINYKRRSSFIDYCEAPWRTGLSPDLILIDGRFRVSCFLTSLMNMATNCRIIFDDYPMRPYYHVVEEFAHLISFNERQAVFCRNQDIDIDDIRATRDQFLMVID